MREFYTASKKCTAHGCLIRQSISPFTNPTTQLNIKEIKRCQKQKKNMTRMHYHQLKDFVGLGAEENIQKNMVSLFKPFLSDPYVQATC